MESKKSIVGDPYYDRLMQFLRASNSETERGKALVAASLIEEMLEEILRAFLLQIKATDKLFESANAPFSTLSAKSSAARAMGLITEEEYRDIEFIRKIRNAFAHSVLCSFADDKVGSWARELKGGMHLIDANKDAASMFEDPSQRFGMVTTALVTGLYNRAKEVVDQRLHESNESSYPSTASRQ